MSPKIISPPPLLPPFFIWLVKGLVIGLSYLEAQVVLERTSRTSKNLSIMTIFMNERFLSSKMKPQVIALIFVLGWVSFVLSYLHLQSLSWSTWDNVKGKTYIVVPRTYILHVGIHFSLQWGLENVNLVWSLSLATWNHWICLSLKTIWIYYKEVETLKYWGLTWN